MVREDGSEGMDAGTCFGDRFPPRVHRIVVVVVVDSVVRVGGDGR